MHPTDLRYSSQLAPARYIHTITAYCAPTFAAPAAAVATPGCAQQQRLILHSRHPRPETRGLAHSGWRRGGNYDSRLHSPWHDYWPDPGLYSM